MGFGKLCTTAKRQLYRMNNLKTNLAKTLDISQFPIYKPPENVRKPLA